MREVQYILFAFALGLGLFLGMLVAMELGRRLGLRQKAKYGDAAHSSVGKADAPVYALLSLLIGFTFSGAGGHFDRRRELMSEQAIAVGRAWERVATLPSNLQGPVRAGFANYLDALIHSYTQIPSRADVAREPMPVAQAHRELWQRAVDASLTESGEKARMLLLPSLNEMFDLAESERLARRIHPPRFIYAMIGVSALAAAVFAGYGLANRPTRSWMYMIGTSATVAIAIYVIIELEYPRVGLLRVAPVDQALIDVRAEMK